MSFSTTCLTGEYGCMWFFDIACHYFNLMLVLLSKSSHWMCYTREPYAWVYGQPVFWVGVLTQCYLVNCVLALFTFKPHRNFFFCVIK